MKVEIRLKSHKTQMNFWKCFAGGLAPWSSHRSAVLRNVTKETFENCIFCSKVWALSTKFFGFPWELAKKIKPMLHMT